MNKTDNKSAITEAEEWVSRITDELSGRESLGSDDMGNEQCEGGRYAGVTEEDVEIVAHALRKWDVPQVEEPSLMAVIESLRTFVPEAVEEGLQSFSKSRRSGFWQTAQRIVRSVPAGYWMCSALSYVVATLLCASGDMNPYIALLLVGPVPALLGVREVFRGREQGMSEIEMACTQSALQVLFAKMSLTALFSLGMNTVLCLVASSVFGLEVWRAIALGLAPWACLSGVGLWIATRLRSGPVIMALLVSWLGGGGVLFTTSWVSRWLLSLNPLAYISVGLTGFTLLCLFAMALHRRKGVEWIVD